MFAVLALAVLCTGGEPPAVPSKTADWLIDGAPFVAELHHDSQAGRLVLTNGLVRRTWALAPNAACIGLDDLVRGASLLRATNPEARLVIDGQPQELGGLVGQANRAFLLEEDIAQLTSAVGAWEFRDFESGPLEARMEWPRVRHHAPNAVWPPPGKHLVLRFTPPAERSQLAGLEAFVHYELYDGLPLMSKWVELRNGGARAIELERVTTEELSIVETSNWVENLRVSPKF